MILAIVLGVLFFLLVGIALYFVAVYNGLIVLSRNI